MFERVPIMKKTIILKLLSIAAVISMVSACASTPTQSASEISTQAASTVEARFTEQAGLTPTSIPATNTPKATATEKVVPTPTDAPSVDGTVKPCLSMGWVGDVTIPDGMLVTPGQVFTKTWRVINDGGCAWDPSYKLVFHKGDAMTEVTEYPLTRTVYPGEKYDFSVEMTAPADPGVYTGYWYVKTPFGGYMVLANYDQSMIAKVEVAFERRLDDQFNAATVEYDWTRIPQKGCTSKGAVYIISARITPNAVGELTYYWNRNPWDGSYEGGRVNFPDVSPKVVKFTWTMTMDHIQNIDRTVWITTVSPQGMKKTFSPGIMFNYHCD